ncbi:ankyrin repeat domain-containing protein [Epilithonimonas sp. JDS]|uniref:ankyrin repeat domain-containing protein n=1 Tax=Epilithonimonas sp. JDS TaxID=2902797 RepID=UPI001E3C3CAF|nr:ankyrin repeat domain-containing protein [Epilithonimonas sp. JDS]MCD9856234.1 ankyrin repeat domain-containing protein [Epilithonimonas sp. JDS]
MKKYLFLLFLMISFLGFSQDKNVFDVARSGTVQEMESLLKQNPDLINTISPMGFTPLILACYRGNVEVAKYLIDMTKDVNYNSPEGTALSSLCINYNKELVEKLLAKKADPNIQDSHGNTPLLWAVKRNNLELVSLLLKNKADINMKDSVGISAFEYAVKSNNTELINLLKH